MVLVLKLKRVYNGACEEDWRKLNLEFTENGLNFMWSMRTNGEIGTQDRFA